MSEYRRLLEEVAALLYKEISNNPKPKRKEIADLLHGLIADMLNSLLKGADLEEDEATEALRRYLDPDIIRRLTLLKAKTEDLAGQVPMGKLIEAAIEAGKEFNLTRGDIILSIGIDQVAMDCQRHFRQLEGLKTAVVAIIPLDESIGKSIAAAMGACPCKSCSSKPTPKKPAYDEIKPHELN